MTEKFLRNRIEEIEASLVENQRRLSVCHTNLGLVYRIRGQHTDAVAQYEKAIGLWDRNLEAKRQIVQEAQALAASEQPVAEQVEGAKRLQQRWKTIGSTPRRPDQVLWRDFRAACDAIFESRDSEKRSEDAEIQSNRQAAEQLLADSRRRMREPTPPARPSPRSRQGSPSGCTILLR